MNGQENVWVDGGDITFNPGNGFLDCNVYLSNTKILLDTKKPYVLVTSNIECVIGEWNKDKGEYGVRVYFVSGNNIWLGGAVARDFLNRFTSGAVAKFDERVKAGPPTVK